MSININNESYPTTFFGNFEYSDCGWIEQNSLHVHYPLEWLILEDDPNNQKMLLLSRQLVSLEGFADCPILGHGYKTSWEKSYVRNWLNLYFFENAFSMQEQSLICTTQIPSEKVGHKRTLDRIFLLSRKEFDKYLSGQSCFVPCYDVFQDSSDRITISNSDYWSWWLRTISPHDDSLVQVVNCDGSCTFIDSNCDETGIRPAMWINYPTDNEST